MFTARLDFNTPAWKEYSHKDILNSQELAFCQFPLLTLPWEGYHLSSVCICSEGSVKICQVFFSDRGTSFSVEAVDGHLGSQWRRVDLDFHFAILRRN